VEVALAELLAHAPIFVRKFDGEILYWTTGAKELYGFSLEAALGRVSHELLNTQFPEPLPDINRVLMATGVWQGILSHKRADGTTIWVHSRWRLRKEDGDGAVVVESNADVTQREALAHELHHRVKNTLAVVQGLARLTFQRDTKGLKEFEERLRALAEVHDLLIQSHWQAASLGEVVERALGGLSIRERVQLGGGELMLKPNSVMAYLLAFHELAVNAIKHGSLSVPEGWVEINWGSYQDERVRVLWRELSGPRPPSERKPGSGTALLNRVVATELGAPVDVRFEESGLVCEFDGPIQKTSHLPEVQPPETSS
jgi:PAS domain S-box-containing protein